MRPEHIQDDEIFHALSLETVTTQLSLWSQTKAIKEVTEMKRKKAEEVSHSNRTNTPIKMVTVLEGNDDATTVFHP